MAMIAKSLLCVNTLLKQKESPADLVHSYIQNPDGLKASDKLLIHIGFWRLHSIL
jgi:hypothetical protein